MEFKFVCRKHETEVEFEDEIEFFKNDSGNMMIDFSNTACNECINNNEALEVFIIISNVDRNEVYIAD